MLHEGSGECPAALTWYQQGFDIAEREVGERAVVTRFALLKLALMQSKVGHLKESKILLQKLLQIQQKECVRAVRVAQTLRLLAVNGNLKNFDSATVCAQEATIIIEEHYGPQHKFTVASRNLYHKLEKLRGTCEQCGKENTTLFRCSRCKLPITVAGRANVNTGNFTERNVTFMKRWVGSRRHFRWQQASVPAAEITTN